METARDIALVFLSLEALALGIVPLLLVVLSIYGVHQLRQWLVRTLRALTQRLRLFNARVERGTSKVVAPFIAVRSRWRQLVVMSSYATQHMLVLERR